MKQFLSMALALMIMVALCGCGGAGSSSASAGAPPATSGGTTSGYESSDEPQYEIEEEQRNEVEEEQHDYRPGTEYTMSRHRSGSGNHPVLRQDEMIYYVDSGFNVCKIPVDGSLSDVQYICNTGDLPGLVYVPEEMQIVGDWLYFLYAVTPDSDTYGITRVRTDGSEIQTLATDMTDDIFSAYWHYGYNTFIVRGDELYYPFKTSQQVSASQYSFTSGLRRVNIETGDSSVLYEENVSGKDACLSISAYTENTALLKSDQNKSIYLYDFDSEQIDTEAISKQYYDYAVFVEDDSYIYQENDQIIAIINGIPYGVVQNGTPFGVRFDDYVLYYLDLETGDRHMVVADKVTSVFSLGDEYLYYICDEHLYRVLPDGTGWERMEWFA